MAKATAIVTGEASEGIPVTSATASPNPSSRPPNRTLHWVLWSFLLLVMGFLAVSFIRQQWRSMERRDITPMEHFKTVPPFSFTTQNGQAFGSDQLKGKIWLANFFFSTCPGPCLRMNHKAMEIQEALLGDHSTVPIVSFTIYPEQDTPEVLHRYADRMKARPDRWYFLTGKRDQIYDVAKRGFMLITEPAPGENGKPPEDGQFIHSTKIALIDREGSVRRYYNTEDPEVIQQVLSDVGSLLREQPAPSAPRQ